MYSFCKKGRHKALAKVKPFLYKTLRFLYTKNRLILFSINGRDIKCDKKSFFQKGFDTFHIKSEVEALNFKNDNYYEIILNEIKKGSTAYLVVSNNQICHYSFVAKSSAYIGEIKRNIILEDQTLYIYNCFTHKDFRGKKLYYLTLLTILSTYASSPYNCTIASLNWNYGSISVIKKTGFLPQGHCVFSSLFGVTRFANSTPYDFQK